MENRRSTDTELPVFSGGEGWYQHIHIVQAIVKSNGWPDETAALQLFVHLKGEALDVALLLKKKVRESWTGLVQGLAAYYQSPGRLAGLRRQFAGAFRHPGLDPATFATDLGMLAIQGFGDMREQARDTMIRDKFIAGQEQCALRRQLDGFAQDTPIGEIVDSCRVWESHSDSEFGKRTRVREGGSAYRTSEDQGATDPGGVPTRIKKGCSLGRCREWMKGVINGEWMVRNSQHWGRRRRPVRSSDQSIPVIQGGAGHGMDTRVRLPGWWTGGCGRQRTVGQFRKETAMFGHGGFKVP